MVRSESSKWPIIIGNLWNLEAPFFKHSSLWIPCWFGESRALGLSDLYGLSFTENPDSLLVRQFLFAPNYAGITKTSMSFCWRVILKLTTEPEAGHSTLQFSKSQSSRGGQPQTAHVGQNFYIFGVPFGLYTGKPLRAAGKPASNPRADKVSTESPNLPLRDSPSALCIPNAHWPQKLNSSSS